MIRRLLLVALALILSWAGVVQPDAVASSSAAEFVHVHAYDGHHDTAVPTYFTRDRSPPDTRDTETTYDADSQVSFGIFARTGEPTTPAAYDDDLARLLQIASRRHGADEPAGKAVPDFGVIERPEVAANGGDNIVYRVIRPDEDSQIQRLRRAHHLKHRRRLAQRTGSVEPPNGQALREEWEPLQPRQPTLGGVPRGWRSQGDAAGDS